MNDFELETEVIYAENIIDSLLPESPYGIIGEEGNIPVESSEVILGQDEGIPDALSLPRNAYVRVDFGENIIINGEGGDIEITTLDGADEFARVEIFADAYYDDGTVETEYFNEIVNVPRGSEEPILIDLDDINFENEEDIFFITASSVKITGLDNRGTSPGFEVYEIIGNNSINKDTVENITGVTIIDNQTRPPIITFDPSTFDPLNIEDNSLEPDPLNDLIDTARLIRNNPEISSEFNPVNEEILQIYNDDPLTGQRGNQSVENFVKRNLPLFQDALGAYFNNIPFVNDGTDDVTPAEIAGGFTLAAAAAAGAGIATTLSGAGFAVGAGYGLLTALGTAGLNYLYGEATDAAGGNPLSGGQMLEDVVNDIF